MSHSSTLAKMSKRVRAGYCNWVFLASLLAVCGGAFAEELDTSVFLRKRTVTLSGYTGNSTLTDFPVLVRLPAAVSSLCMPGGDDIRFADAAGNLLNHEVDTWNPDGESLVWVCVPSLSGTDTTLTLYYCGGQSQFVNPRLVWATGACGTSPVRARTRQRTNSRAPTRPRPPPSWRRDRSAPCSPVPARPT